MFYVILAAWALVLLWLYAPVIRITDSFAREFALWCTIFGAVAYGVMFERGPNSPITLPALAVLTSLMGAIQLSIGVEKAQKERGVQ